MNSYLSIIFSMLIFGSIGIFVKSVSLPSSEIVFVRSAIGSLFLILVFLLLRRRVDRAALKKNLPLLIVSGAVMGFNWVFLFEAYRYTSVSVATVAYYCAPVFVMIAAAVLLREKLTLPKVLGILAAMGGILLINSGSMGGGSDPLRGLLCGLLAAVFYAGITIMNKFVRGLGALEATIIQTLSAAVVVGCYALATHRGPVVIPTGWPLVALLILAIVHTGLAVYLYFSGVRALPGQTVALLSYIDPLSALVFSALFLQERLGGMQLLGALLVLGGAAAGELIKTKKPSGKRA